MLTIDPLSCLQEALSLMIVRNECRQMMTQDQHEILPEEQKEWFENFYSKQNPLRYRVWLLKNDGVIIGYFAAKECREGFYITEGIRKDQRGQGRGHFLLKTMARHAEFRNKTLFADIFNDNLASIRLHLKLGFLLCYQDDHKNTARYQLIC